MLQRLSLTVLGFLGCALLWQATPKAASQLVEKKQTLVIGYPTTGIVISDQVPVYKGIIYVKVYPANAGLGGSSGAPVVAWKTLVADVSAVPATPVTL